MATSKTLELILRNPMCRATFTYPLLAGDLNKAVPDPHNLINTTSWLDMDEVTNTAWEWLLWRIGINRWR